MRKSKFINNTTAQEIYDWIINIKAGDLLCLNNTHTNIEYYFTKFPQGIMMWFITYDGSGYDGSGVKSPPILIPDISMLKDFIYEFHNNVMKKEQEEKI